MKIEALTQEQIEKARSLATNEERLAYLEACGVELDDDMLAEVAGGKKIIGNSIESCKKGPNKNKPHKWVYTGRTIKKFFGLFEVKEVKCIYCGKIMIG